MRLCIWSKRNAWDKMWNQENGALSENRHERCTALRKGQKCFLPVTTFRTPDEKMLDCYRSQTISGRLRGEPLSIMKPWAVLVHPSFKPAKAVSHPLLWWDGECQGVTKDMIQNLLDVTNDHLSCQHWARWEVMRIVLCGRDMSGYKYGMRRQTSMLVNLFAHCLDPQHSLKPSKIIFSIWFESKTAIPLSPASMFVTI